MTTPQPLDLPTEASDWLTWLQDRVTARLAETAAAIAKLKDGAQRSADQVLELWNDADIALGAASASANLFSEVHPDAALRDRAQELEQEIDRVRTERGLDRELYEVLAATQPAGLDAQAKRLHERVLRDFRRSGVDRSELDRARLREIADRITVLDQEISQLIREDVRSIRITPERLAGLPADFIEAHQPDEDGLVAITTDYPDVMPFRAFATDAEARRELMVAFLNRGWPDNDARLHELFDLRAEQAGLVGYDSWPAYDADVKMVGTAAGIAEFVDRVSVAAEPAARRDFDTLLARRRRDEPDASRLDAASTAYYSELVRCEDFAVDAQEVRRYFDFAKVRAGLLDVTGRLFGIEYRPVPAAAVWHEDVTAYDVVVDGHTAGRIYLDLHPRDGKFKHAAQFDLVGGVTGRELAEGVLVCNLPRGLMEHGNVVTLFHEFGHLLHHVLGGQQHWVRFSGVATEWDFVEAPSQMLEEWAWDPAVLQTFATDPDGHAIPADLVARMRAAQDFGKGMFVRTQLFYAAVSYHYHAERPADLTAALRELQERYDLNSYLDGTHFHASFGHLTGYSSAYYTYLWSLVIAKDLFSAFEPDDLLAGEVAQRYRDAILVPGGSRDAADLVADFLGRPFGFDAFAAWIDRVAVPV